MLIRTIRQTYHVIRTMPCGKGIQAYLCDREKSVEDDKAAGDERFLVMAPKDQELSPKMLLYFMDLAKSQRVNRFEECFTKDSVVWVVFRYCEGVPLAEAVEEEKSFGERLDLCKALIEQILAQNLPAYLQYEALNASNIVVSKKWGLQVNYRMMEPEQLEKELFPEVQKRIAENMHRIFWQELERDLSETLGCFVKKLEGAEFQDQTAVYRDYRHLDNSLRCERIEGDRKENGYLTHVWKFVTTRSKGIFHILYGLLIAGLLALLAYVCIMPETAPDDRNLFQSIGTLEIIREEPDTADSEISNTRE